jgi:hypothetical protein
MGEALGVPPRERLLQVILRFREGSTLCRNVERRAVRNVPLSLPFHDTKQLRLRPQGDFHGGTLDEVDTPTRTNRSNPKSLHFQNYGHNHGPFAELLVEEFA